MRLGAQLSTARGLETVFQESADWGLTAVQVFSRSPVGGQSKELPKTGTVSAWLEQARIRPFFVHAPYFVNPAAVDGAMQQRARSVLAEEMVRVKRLSGDFLVLHPGHWQPPLETNTLEGALEVLAGTLRHMLTRPGFILMENTAGQGREIGGSLSDLVRLFHHLGRVRRVGILLDTAHAMASGFPLQTADDVSRLLDDIGGRLGWERIRGIHLNDSMYPVGSHRDRHAHLLEGQMGMAALEALVQRAVQQDWPLILETPGSTVEARKADIEAVRRAGGEGCP